MAGRKRGCPRTERTFRRPAQPIIVALLTVAAVGACNPGAATVVVNTSGHPFVVEAVDPRGGPIYPPRYYPLPSGSSVLVDTVGHHNLAIVTLTVLDSTCTTLDEIEGDFEEEASVSVGEGWSIDFAAGRSSSIDLTLRGPDEYAGSFDSCELASDQL